MRRNKDTAPDVAADLRALADLCERNETAADLVRAIVAKDIWPNHVLGGETPKENMAQAIRVLKPIATSIDKSYIGDYLEVAVTLRGGVVITLTDAREKVCTRVVTGTREVVEEIADPDALAAVPKVTRTRVEEIVEWQCEPLLGSVPA